MILFVFTESVIGNSALEITNKVSFTLFQSLLLSYAFYRIIKHYEGRRLKNLKLNADEKLRNITINTVLSIKTLIESYPHEDFYLSSSPESKMSHVRTFFDGLDRALYEDKLMLEIGYVNYSMIFSPDDAIIEKTET